VSWDGSIWGTQGLLWGGSPGGRMIDRFFLGLTGIFVDARQFIDDVYFDLFADTTRALPEWEGQFAIQPVAPATADRIDAVNARWKAQGGQSPSYLQTTVQAAGFPLYLHEWWEPPYNDVRDPRDHTSVPLIGQYQCGQAEALCRDFAPQAQCNNFLANDPGYLVNDNLLPLAPPPITDDSDTWVHFLYWGGETFGDRVEIPASRRAELEQLVLQICPTHAWLVMLVDYI